MNKRKYDCNRLDWGWSEFATLSQVAEQFVVDDAITVAVEIRLLDYDRGVLPNLSFVHAFDAAAAANMLDPGSSVLSSLVQDKGGNKWRLTLYPQGKGVARNKHMSLYLQASGCEELPLGWWKSVSYRIVLLGRRLCCREWLRYLRLDGYHAQLRAVGIEVGE